MLAKTIMVQGTASDVGKSLFVTALCRIFKRQGYRVAPFKAQNMANNSFVTKDGGEIGRAQVVQAEACGIEPSVYMNPILLKPTSDRKSQIVVLGKPVCTIGAKDYQLYKKNLKAIVDESLHILRLTYDLVIIEGAGSAAEINMKEHDLVNMSLAKSIDSPVILVADIDKGGVFAQIVGTYELFDKKEKELTVAFVINKFRGDKSILIPGIQWMEDRIGRKSLGVLPLIKDLNIEQEDSVYLDKTFAQQKLTGVVKKNHLLIYVVKLPRISNFTDFEILAKEDNIQLEYIDKPNRNCFPDLLIIPGTKSTLEDMDFLNTSGLTAYIKRCAKADVFILGICGGYQILGKELLDVDETHSKPIKVKGLNLLPIKTIFLKEKITQQIKAVHIESQSIIEGYEIHTGRTEHLKALKPAFKIMEKQGSSVEEFEGVIKKNIMGSYIHGLFNSLEFRQGFLNTLRKKVDLYEIMNTLESNKPIDVYNQLANEVEPHIDMNLLEEILTVQYT